MTNASPAAAPTPVASAGACGPAPAWDQHKDLIWLSAEIERATQIPPVPIDWQGMLTRANAVLSTSTDWVLLCAASRAAVELQGAAMLASSIDRLGEAAQHFWADMHPALPRGNGKRVSYFEWFVEGLANALRSKRVVGSRAELVQAQQRLAALDDLLRPLVGPTYPGVRILREQLAAAIGRLPSDESRTDAAHRPGPGPVGPAAPDTAGITDADSADRAVSNVRTALFAAADILQAADPTSAQPYRLRRLAAWIRLDAAPASVENRLKFRGPAGDVYERLNGSLAGDTKGVLEEAEASLKPYPLWLDANYLAYRALLRLGAQYAEAAEAVRAETLALSVRIPLLIGLLFENDVPLASEDTKSWLKAELGKLIVPAMGVDSAASVNPAGDRLADAERAAQELAQRGELEASFAVLDDGIRETASGRERFRWRLAAARHALRTGRTSLAVDLIEGLDREAAELRLDLWEPGLWAEVLKAVVGSGKKGRRGSIAQEVLERLPDIEKRLARLDLMAALQLSNDRR